ncbi:MAG: AAA family ATPase [Candidatus Saccharimonadales bacterium]
MSKILITGSSGVGKSTVIQELGRRGYIAIDGDAEPGLARLEIRETGEPVEWPKGFVDWHAYSWNLQEPVLKRALSRDETMFLGGIYGNQPDYYHLFDKLIVLDVTPEEHLRRLDTRPTRPVGDDNQNIQDKLGKYPILMKRFLDSGFVPVYASGNVAQTVDRILELVEHEN